MEATTPITKHSVGTTFLISVGLVALIALVELGAIAWAFIARFQSSLPTTAAVSESASPVINAPEEAPGSRPSAGADKLAMEDPLAAPEATPFPAQPPAMPRPTPVPLAKKEQQPAADRATELVEQARALRERGDTLTALTRLREAQAFVPDQPQAISEMAITYEKMGAPEKAKGQWQRILLMGESAGIYYAAAEAKLNRDPSRPSPVHEASPSDPNQNNTAGATMAQQQPVGTPAATEFGGTKDPTGFQPNSSLALAQIVREEVNDPAAQTKFTVKIPVKSRPGTKVDVHEVVIQVFFYDLLDNKSIVQTNANVNSQWTTAPTDWTEDNMEILEVEYSQPRPDVRELSRPVESRKYYGYIARVYYKKELQDMRAEPVKLLQQFPPPVTLQTEESR